MKITSLLLLLFFIVSCKHDNAAPITEQIQKIWLANMVKEGSTTVFVKGSATNVRPGYAQFRLDLHGVNSGSLTEFDGNTFTGTWELSADQKILKLNNLSPQPTATGGTISYTINSVSDTELILTRTTESTKTGNTINTYSLIR